MYFCGPLTRPKSRSRLRAVAQGKTQFPEDPLALAHAELQPKATAHVLGQRRPVPESCRESTLLRGLQQVRLQLVPLLHAERARPPGSLTLPQCTQSAPLEAADPTLHRGVVLAEKPCHVATGVACRQQQQSVESMVIPGLFAARELLLNGAPHDLSGFDL